MSSDIFVELHKMIQLYKGKSIGFDFRSKAYDNT